MPGLTGAAVRTGVKDSKDLDLALVASGEAMVASGVFTRNRMPAAPVTLCRERLARSASARCVVVNSGNANAMTGSRGMEDALAMAERAEEKLGAPALVMSTGIIGVPLPVQRVLDGIDAAAAQMGNGSGAEMARAIMTTDTRPKRCALVRESEGGTITVGGMAKGSGMIHPNMATMLCIVATDAHLDPEASHEILTRAVDHSFHEITVDGDTSTNDGVILLSRPPGERGAGGHDHRCIASKLADGAGDVHAAAAGVVRFIVRAGLAGRTNVVRLARNIDGRVERQRDDGHGNQEPGW